MRFDQIVSAVASGEIDAGLIIHESRFTYRDAGLIAIADLGEWWETMTLLPIPLGAILVRDDVDDAAAAEINAAIRRSLAFARANEDAVMPYVRDHAAEMNDDVMRAHIELYVNEFSDDLGDERPRGRARALRARPRSGHSAPGDRATFRRSFLAAGAGFVAACTTRTQAQPLPPARIELGDEAFLRREWRELGGRTVGVITNQSGVTSRLESIVDAILRHGRDSNQGDLRRPSTVFAAIATRGRP